ncbi:MAG: phycobilisome linker polypeptide [Woronichinia naegeliana WA131]|uniref:Phycobilisome linker polypeptide n=1 Tax=Woronichinia naegeliana WA131 TaxID=2824559 RepID=A0A977L0J5_9CYAN|nr:MAG: phycobilisome linker polypeptide [Woronichinia naegeliana WA131]
MGITVAASRLGVEPYSNTNPIELRPDFSQDDANAVIRAVYRQVLGNDYVMESERLKGAESLLRNGSISVRDFVRSVAQSELYKGKFFYNNFQTRVIELNYKHLLGRAPYDESEVIFHLDLYENEGFDAEIDSYIDSVEYQENFGENIVPYYRFNNQVGDRTVGFTRIFGLYRGYATSDRAHGKAKLTRELAQNSVSPIYIGSTGESLHGTSAGSRNQFYRLRVIQGAAPGRTTRVRRSSAEVIVSYEQLSNQLQQINRQGGTVTSITLA